MGWWQVIVLACIALILALMAGTCMTAVVRQNLIHTTTLEEIQERFRNGLPEGSTKEEVVSWLERNAYEFSEPRLMKESQFVYNDWATPIGAEVIDVSIDEVRFERLLTDVYFEVDIVLDEFGTLLDIFIYELRISL